MPQPRDEAASAKRAAAIAAVAEVEDGMRVGLGTGSTAAFAIAALGERVAGGLRVTTVATSRATARIATAAGLRVLAFDDLSAVDIAVDGADQIDPMLRAIKGGGGAMLREKIVAQAASRMIAIVDAAKQVDVLDGAVPVEVLPFARGFVASRIEMLGATVSIRMDGAEPASTDQGNRLLDCGFGRMEQPEPLALDLSSIPGLLAHGLFLDEIDVAYVGHGRDVLRLTRNRPHSSS